MKEGDDQQLIVGYLQALVVALEPSGSIEIPGLQRAVRDIQRKRHRHYVEMPDDSTPAAIDAALAAIGIQ